MNDFRLFTLSDAQKIQYNSQPDVLVDFNWIHEDDHEIIPYMPGTAMRFWYNNLTTHYSTHWHNSVEIIVPLEKSNRPITSLYKNTGKVINFPPTASGTP